MRTGLPMHTLAAFIELRPIWAKVDLQLLGVLSSAVRKLTKTRQCLKKNTAIKGSKATLSDRQDREDHNLYTGKGFNVWFIQHLEL